MSRLIFSYGMLTMTAVVVLAYDSAERADVEMQTARKPRIVRREAPVDIQILPLAQSPYREARTGSTELARHSQSPGRLSMADIHRSESLFLKVSVQVDMEGKSVSLDRGTAVEFVRKMGSKLVVKHEDSEFIVERWQVTDDRAKLDGLARSSS